MNSVCAHCGHNDCVEVPRSSERLGAYSFCLFCKVYFVENRRIATPPSWVKEFAHKISPVPQRIL